MKSKIVVSSIVFLLIFVNATLAIVAKSIKIDKTPYYQLIIYHLKDKDQEDRTDKFLKESYLPALHRLGMKTIGVFKSEGIDTVADKRIYVLLSFTSLSQFEKTSQLIGGDQALEKTGNDYLNAAYDHAPFVRKESILMKAFEGMQFIKQSGLINPRSERIYELRSYEGSTEYLSKNKIGMFNKEELEIFERIGSRPIFYAEVLAGSRMPNLMYMTSYKDKASREAQWKIFFSDPKWKQASALPKYQHNNAKADIIFLFPTEYSDI
jgi:hypothetical protein